MIGRLYDRLDETANVRPPAGAPGGVAMDGTPVQNIHPYDRRGHLLRDVRLYDQDGRPLDVGHGFADRYRRPPHTKDGQPVYNAFPVRWPRKIAQPSTVVRRLEPKPLSPRP